MTLVAFCLFVVLVLTVTLGWRYIDSIRDERYSDAYEQGWANGYDVGKRNKPDSEGELDRAYDLGYAAGLEDGKRKAPVKKAKKITSKEN